MKVILFCGGHGTRLWPISRKSYPKPFVQIVNGKSFLQITYARYRKILSPEDIFISTEDRYISFVRSQVPEVPRKNIICEPERKDTLGAIGLAVAVVDKYYPGEVVVISWAKHLFDRESVFLNAISAAGEFVAKTGMIVAVDSKPEFPSVHWGWVKTDKLLETINGFKIREQVKHVEKPKMALAKRFFASPDWAVHTGYKVLRTDAYLDLFRVHQSAMYQGLQKIVQAWGTDKQEKVLIEEYAKFPETSIDYGLYEKISENSNVRASIAVDMGWEDAFISWETFYKAFITPKNKMVVEGGVDVEFLESENNLVIGRKGKMISIIGISNIAVIDTPDGLLISSMDKTQKVKDVYKKIERYHPEYTE